MIWCILIGLLVGTTGGIISYFFLNKRETKALPDLDFFNKKNQVIQGLQKKKDAYEKEMTEEARRETESFLQGLTKKKELAESEASIQILNYKNQIERAKQETADANISLKEGYESNKRVWAAETEALRKFYQDQVTAETSAYERKRSAELEQLKVSYDHKEKGMTEDFLAYSADISTKREALMNEIAAFEEKQRAIIARFRQDEEIRQRADFYHIIIDAAAQRDVGQLKGLALQFSKPEILYKLLYEVYYKAKMEELFKRVLGENKDKAGIYKITDIQNQKVYIGKTTKFLDRWRTHAKRGCGIERIKGQLYNAMFDKGLENFTWEIVEICSKDILAEREKYWTTFYKSEEWGYNMKVG